MVGRMLHAAEGIMMGADSAVISYVANSIKVVAYDLEKDVYKGEPDERPPVLNVLYYVLRRVIALLGEA